MPITVNEYIPPGVIIPYIQEHTVFSVHKGNALCKSGTCLVQPKPAFCY